MQDKMNKGRGWVGQRSTSLVYEQHRDLFTEQGREINRQLALLHQTALAEEWGVSKMYVCLIFQGQSLFSPLVKKLASKLRTTEQDLRGVLSDRAHVLTEQKVQNCA